MSVSRNILEERWRAFSDREQFDVIGHLNEIRAGDDDAYDTASKLLESLAMRAAAEPECSGNPDLRHDNCAADCSCTVTRHEEITRLRTELSFFARKCQHGDPLPAISSGWCWCGRGMRAEARVAQLEAALLKAKSYVDECFKHEHYSDGVTILLGQLLGAQQTIDAALVGSST
jgi:hypothetical protein